MRVFALKKKYSETKPLNELKKIEEPSVEIKTIPLKMSIYDAWRSGKISLECYQKWINDGYPKTLPIEIKQ